MSAGANDSSADIRAAASAAVVISALLIGQGVAGRALRDGFFLTHFPASALPSVMTTASILSVAIVLGSARFLRGIAPATSLPIFFAGNSALFTCEWALSLSLPRVAAVILYLHTTSIGAVVVSGFWSTVNERFDPFTAKQLMGRIGTGASVGGVLGGLAAWGGASFLDVQVMILILGGVNALCAIGARRIGGPRQVRQESEESGGSAIEIFQETPYLRNLALLVALAAFMGAVYDYVFKAQAAEAFLTSAELVSFFALFYLGLSIGTLVIQRLLAKRFLTALGLAVTVGTLPGSGVALGALALLVPGMWTAAAMRAGISVVESSLYRSGYELLYTPILPEKKRPTKTLVDVGGDKLGAAAGGAFAFFVLGIFPASANSLLLGFGVAAGFAALLVTRRLHQGYVSSLAESLRTGSLRAGDLETLDATTQQTVSHTVVEMERQTLVNELTSGTRGELAPRRGEVLEQLRRVAAQGDMGEEKQRPYAAPPRQAPELSEIDPLVGAIVDLRSGHPTRIEKALAENSPISDLLVGHTIALLDDEAVANAATEALRRVAPANTGVLLDAALHTRTPLSVRRRVCGILGKLPTQRCAAGLTLLLEDRDFELRFRAATGLLEIARANSKLRLADQLLFAAAEQEAAECSRQWRYQKAIDGRLTRVPPLESDSGKRVVRGIAYVFTLLLTVLDREPLQLAIRALGNSDPGERGTGLEYLDNVLPPTLRNELWPILLDTRISLRNVLSRAQLLSEIVSDTRAGPVDLAELRRRIDAYREQSRVDTT